MFNLYYLFFINKNKIIKFYLNIKKNIYLNLIYKKHFQQFQNWFFNVRQNYKNRQ